MAGAGRFAEAALDAGVGHRLDLGNGLQPAQMGLRVAVEHDPGGQHPVGVDDLFRAPHQLGRPRAPLQLQERGDVAAGGVLRLERSVEPLHGEPAEVRHERGVPVDVGLFSRVERQQEVQIAVGRVARDGGIETVLGLEGQQRLASVGQPGGRDREVLRDQRRPGRAGAADRGDEGLAGLPVSGDGPGVAGERVGHRGDGPDQVQLPYDFGRRLLVRLLARFVRCAELHQQGRGLLRQPGPVAGHPLDTDRGAQGVPVHQLHGDGTRFVEQRDGRRGRCQRGEEEQRGGDAAVQRQRVEHDLGDETEGPLRTDHETAQDLHRRRTVQEGVEPVAVGVLDLVLRPDPGGERGVGLDLRLQGEQPLAEPRLRVRQVLVRRGIARVHHRSARQHEGEGGDGPVRIAGGAGGHPGGVVGDDPADRAGDRARRVGPQQPAVPGEGGVRPHDRRPRTDPGPRTAVQDLDACPVVPYVDEDVLALRLAVQAGARRPEDDVAAPAVGVRQDRGDVVDVLRDDDDLGHEPVRTRVGGVPHQVGDLPEHLLRAQERGQLAPQGFGRARRLSVGHPVVGRGPDRAGAQGLRVRLQQRHVQIPSAARRGASHPVSSGAPAFR